MDSKSLSSDEHYPPSSASEVTIEPVRSLTLFSMATSGVCLLVGTLVFGWSIGGLIVLYALENVVLYFVAIAMTFAIWRLQRLTIFEMVTTFFRDGTFVLFILCALFVAVGLGQAFVMYGAILSGSLDFEGSKDQLVRALRADLLGGLWIFFVVFIFVEIRSYRNDFVGGGERFLRSEASFFLSRVVPRMFVTFVFTAVVAFLTMDAQRPDLIAPLFVVLATVLDMRLYSSDRRALANVAATRRMTNIGPDNDTG